MRNKKIISTLYGFLIILLAGSNFLGCMNSDKESLESGYFVLSIDGAEADKMSTKTVVPATPDKMSTKTVMPLTPVKTDFAEYKLVFSPSGSNSNPVQTVTRNNVNLSDPISLPAGTWDLVVSAYKNSGDAEPTAEGALLSVIDIKSGGTTSGTVTLEAIISGGQGTFSYTIGWGGVAVTSAVMTIEPLGVGGTAQQNVSLANGTPGSRTLNSGYYRVVILLVNNTGQSTGWREIVHIYKNLTSNFAHTFTAANFFAPLSASITVSIEIQMKGPVDWTDPCVGETLVASTLPSGTYRYQWYRGSTPIGTNSAIYTFATADEGGPNSFSVTVTQDGYNGGAISSPLVLTVEPVPDGTSTKPFRIYDETDLRLFARGAPARPTWTRNHNYRLMRSITLTQGDWAPIGTYNSGAFNGIFDGGNNTITGLTISASASDYQGLFGCIYDGNSIVKNLGLINVSVTGNDYVGGLVGYNYGTVQDCYIAGSVTGNERVGGLVGYNSGYNSGGTVQDCNATCSVTGNKAVGGLVGSTLSSTVQNCNSTGNVIGNTQVGGLVGFGSGMIQNCYATGNVTGSGFSVGGLVGDAPYCSVQNCYATGSVTGNGTGFSYVGGLVGYGSVQNCYATGSVTGSGYSQVGGLVGHGGAQNCYATGNVTGNTQVGGLVGFGSAQNCYATGNVTGNDRIGGLVGYGDGVQNCVALSTTITRTDGSSGVDFGRVAGWCAVVNLSNNYAYSGMVGVNVSLPSSSLHNAPNGANFPGWGSIVGWTAFHSSKAVAAAAVGFDPDAWPWWWDGSGNPKLWFAD